MTPMQSWKSREVIGDEGSDAVGPALARTLAWPPLVALGVGAIVSSGILTPVGVGADKAGPAVLVSRLIAGFVRVGSPSRALRSAQRDGVRSYIFPMPEALPGAALQ